MRKLVIQDHIIGEIYEYINSSAHDVPEYVKFAYVADRYSDVKAQLDRATKEDRQSIEELKNKIQYGYKKNLKFLSITEEDELTEESKQKVLDSKYTEAEVQGMEQNIANLEKNIAETKMQIIKESIPLPESLDQYDEKYQNCQKIEGFINYYKSNESKFCLPKETEKKFLKEKTDYEKLKQELAGKCQSLSEAIVYGNQKSIDQNKLDICKFLLLNPLLVADDQKIGRIIITFNTQLNNLEVDQETTKLNEIAEALSKDRTFSEWLMELVHDVVKFFTFSKFQPFTEETKIAQAKDGFKDYLEKRRANQANEIAIQN